MLVTAFYKDTVENISNEEYGLIDEENSMLALSDTWLNYMTKRDEILPTKIKL